MNRQRKLVATLLVAGLVASLPACSGGDEAPAPAPSERAPAKPAPKPPSAPAAAAPAADAEKSPEELLARGKAVYITNCAACHNVDPSKEGSLGPPVTGASVELLEARILRAEYPPGYTPKRDSALMLKLPHLEKEIAALFAYLNAAG